MNKIKDKINEIEGFLDQLEDIVPSGLEEYKSNLEKKAACERYAERIIEATVDLAFMAIKSKKFEIPADDMDAFNILSGKKIIDGKLATKLKHANGMRNIIAHEYGKIEDEIVFHSVTEELEKDIREFIEVIEKLK